MPPTSNENDRKKKRDGSNQVDFKEAQKRLFDKNGLSDTDRNTLIFYLDSILANKEHSPDQETIINSFVEFFGKVNPDILDVLGEGKLNQTICTIKYLDSFGDQTHQLLLGAEQACVQLLVQRVFNTDKDEAARLREQIYEKLFRSYPQKLLSEIFIYSDKRADFSVAQIIKSLKVEKDGLSVCNTDRLLILMHKLFFERTEGQNITPFADK